MNINDLFCSFFGISSRYDADRRRRDDDSSMVEDVDDDLPDFSNLNDMFHHFHGDMMLQMGEMQRQMEEMFTNFGAVEFPGERIEGSESQQDAGTLRDKMLKGRDESNSPFGTPTKRPNLSPNIPEQPPHKIDLDLDENVNASNLGELFGSQGHQRLKPGGLHSPFTSRFQSVSIRKIHLPDGTIEETRTTRDSEGNEETTVTQTKRDNSHTITRRLDPTRDKQVDRDSTDKIPGFEHNWQPRLGWKEIGKTPENEDSDISIFRKLFGKFLPDKKV